MRIINTSALKGNEILGKQIFDGSGRVLLNSGVKLTLFYIEKIKSLGIESVYIDDQISKNIEIEESVSEKTRQTSKQVVKEMIEKYCREGKTDNSSILKSVNSVIDDIHSNKDLMINVTEIKTSDNSVYSHSVNVCVLSTIIGTHMGYNMLRLKDLSVGAILHDIGKIKIKNDKKTTTDIKTEVELENYIRQNHPRVGYDFLSEQNFCSSYSKVSVLMYHERIDGSGYPLKLKGKEISEMAKLISVCDTFNNMIKGINNEQTRPVNEVIEYLFAMSNTYFDAEIVKKFTSNVAAFPTGSGVILNTNEKCLVIKQNKSFPLRPIVKIIFDRAGNYVPEPYELDLLKELTLSIKSGCEINI